MGVGTTAIAATLLGRNYIGIESLSEYVEEARKNIGELGIGPQQTEA
jgi:DNA modification methylase